MAAGVVLNGTTARTVRAQVMLSILRKFMMQRNERKKRMIDMDRIENAVEELEAADD